MISVPSPSTSTRWKLPTGAVRRKKASPWLWLEVVSGPETNFDVNGNLGGHRGGGEVGLDAAESLAQEDFVVNPEVEESENDALTDGNNTDQEPL